MNNCDVNIWLRSQLIKTIVTVVVLRLSCCTVKAIVITNSFNLLACAGRYQTKVERQLNAHHTLWLDAYHTLTRTSITDEIRMKAGEVKEAVSKYDFNRRYSISQHGIDQNRNLVNDCRIRAVSCWHD